MMIRVQGFIGFIGLSRESTPSLHFLPTFPSNFVLRTLNFTFAGGGGGGGGGGDPWSVDDHDTCSSLSAPSILIVHYHLTLTVFQHFPSFHTDSMPPSSSNLLEARVRRNTFRPRLFYCAPRPGADVIRLVLDVQAEQAHVWAIIRVESAKGHPGTPRTWACFFGLRLVGLKGRSLGFWHRTSEQLPVLPLPPPPPPAPTKAPSSLRDHMSAGGVSARGDL